VAQALRLSSDVAGVSRSSLDLTEGLALLAAGLHWTYTNYDPFLPLWNSSWLPISFPPPRENRMVYPRDPLLFPDELTFVDRVSLLSRHTRLTKRQAQVSLLHVECCDHEQIAATLGIAKDTSRTSMRCAPFGTGVNQMDWAQT
jgi:hypothetical protein